MTQEGPLARWEGEPVAHWRARWGVPELLVFDHTGSTNDRVRERAAAGAAAGTTVIAEYQTEGRGRLGRSWEARAGQALLASVLLRPAAGGAAEAAAVLPLRVGLALAGAIERLIGRPPGLKWPNDLELDGRKVAGILCEAGGEGVVVGIGVNVAQAEADFPPELRAGATSLRLAAGRPPARAALAGLLLERLAPLFTAPPQPLTEDERARFAALDVLSGHRVSVDDVPAGTAAGVSPTGSLVVLAEGERRLVHAGTVRSLP